ncbi:MAG: MerR family transcriptional regulator [Candidatus Schekmanbacteria bacterium]|nr:MAG: MerR family transcriptional regulator [Candidatus Schekmanbacteria bacterium]
MARKKAGYSIGAVAQMLDIHPQTLRIYEREGLVKPKRTSGNTRVYTEEDIKKIELIQRLTHELGVNLAGVEIILRMSERIEEMQKEMDNMLKTLLEHFSEELKKWQETQSSALVKVQRRDVAPIKKKRK